MKPPRRNRQPTRKSIPSAAVSSRSSPENSSRSQKRKASNTTPDATEDVSVHPAPINLMQPQLAEGGPSHHNTVRQQSVDWPNRVEDRNRSAQLTEGNNRDTSPVNPDGSAGSTNYTQMVGLGGGSSGPSFGLNAPLQQAFQRTGPECRPQAHTHTRPSLEDLATEADSLIAHSLATNTWKTYKMAADSLLRFRREYRFPDSWPVPLDQLLNFVDYLSFTGLSPTSVTTYILGIGYTHKARGLEDKTNNFSITNILEGLRRKRVKSSDVHYIFCLNSSKLFKKFVL